MGVLRRQLVTRAARHADAQRYVGLAAEHVADLRRVVHDLVVATSEKLMVIISTTVRRPSIADPIAVADDDLFAMGASTTRSAPNIVEQSIGYAIGAARNLPMSSHDQIDRIVALHLLARASRSATRYSFSSAIRGDLRGARAGLPTRPRTTYL